MPVEETNTLNISCDNPKCPGNDLDPKDRTGWIFISHEVYGAPTAQNVFCSYACVGAAASAKPEVNPLVQAVQEMTPPPPVPETVTDTANAPTGPAPTTSEEAP